MSAMTFLVRWQEVRQPHQRAAMIDRAMADNLPLRRQKVRTLGPPRLKSYATAAQAQARRKRLLAKHGPEGVVVTINEQRDPPPAPEQLTLATRWPHRRNLKNRRTGKRSRNV